MPLVVMLRANYDIFNKKDATHKGLKLVFLLYGIWAVQMMARGTIPIIPARLQVKDFFYDEVWRSLRRENIMSYNPPTFSSSPDAKRMATRDWRCLQRDLAKYCLRRFRQLLGNKFAYEVRRPKSIRHSLDFNFRILYCIWLTKRLNTLKWNGEIIGQDDVRRRAGRSRSNPRAMPGRL
jgi:hypothetical protein